MASVVDEHRQAAYVRAGDFAWAVRHARGWTQKDVERHCDALGRSYVSARTLGDVERASWPGERGPYEKTWRLLDLALKLEPGTMLTVLNNPDHGLDPKTLPLWEPPRATSRSAVRPGRLTPAEQRAAERIADEALRTQAS